MSSARYCAVKLLGRTFSGGGYSNILLDSALSEWDMEQREKAFCTSLYYGVLERRITLDHIISGYSKTKLSKLHPDILNILRIGIYQLKYMDGVPESAAINESVKLAKKMRLQRLSGFVNAVLRSFQRDGFEIKYPDKKSQKMAVMYSSPQWLVNKLIEEYGESAAVSLLKSYCEKPPVTVRLNTLKGSDGDILREMEELQPQMCSMPEHCAALGNPAAVTKSEAFKNGMFHVQDIASQLCCMALSPKEGETVLDMCSAPGGKAFTMAQLMNGKGSIYAFDLHESRVRLIQKGAQRLGLSNIIAECGDASKHNEDIPPADKILCDVPCSGLGVIRRKPEIKYKAPEEFEKLPEIQYGILENAASYLKIGGELVYSTCTLSRAENDEVIKRFLENHSDYKGISFLEDLGEPFGGYRATLVPEYFGSDGFFISKLRRIG